MSTVHQVGKVSGIPVRHARPEHLYQVLCAAVYHVETHRLDVLRYQCAHYVLHVLLDHDIVTTVNIAYFLFSVKRFFQLTNATFLKSITVFSTLQISSVLDYLSLLLVEVRY